MTNINNNAQFTGRLTRDVSIQAHKPNANGKVPSATALFSVAVQDNFKSKNEKGVMEYKTQFITLSAFVKEQKEVDLYNSLYTGDLVNISAHFQSNKQDDVFYLNIILDSIETLEPKYIRKARQENRQIETKVEEPIGLKL